jgi:hypothetical protein
LPSHSTLRHNQPPKQKTGKIEIALQGTSCHIIPFPGARRAAEIEQTADALLSRNGEEANEYWRKFVAGMRLHMAAAGMPVGIIDRELRDFAENVFARIGDSHSVCKSRD